MEPILNSCVDWTFVLVVVGPSSIISLVTVADTKLYAQKCLHLICALQMWNKCHSHIFRHLNIYLLNT